MSEAAYSSWAFGGPLADVPPEAGWTLLAVVAALCALAAWISYRHAVQRLGLFPALVLTLLRTAVLGLILLCLANPVRIERTTAKAPEPLAPAPAAPPPRLAVIVDRSDSMTQPDNRGRSRLDEALSTWRRLAKSAQGHFGPIDYFSVAQDLRPATSLEEASTRQGSTAGTQLYASVSALLKNEKAHRPDAVVILTDGVDNSGQGESALRDAAIDAGIPLYFVAGANRGVRPEPFVRVREFRLPHTAPLRSEFKVEVTFEAFSRADRTVPFSLWQKGRRLLREELALTMGTNVVSRTFTVTASATGPEEFALRLGAADDAPLAARGVTQVLSRQEGKIRILVHQSSLDWGLRYFTGALRTDPSFEYITLVTANMGLTLTGGNQSGSTIIGQLPDVMAPLAQFNCVVLVRPSPRTLTVAQQEALVDFVRSGGTLFFLSPDAAALAQFNSSPLKNLLPVTLNAAAATSAAKENAESAKATTLTTAALTEAGRASPIFARAGGTGAAVLPRFLDYTPTGEAKPAAEVLAVHPSAIDPASGAPHVLLATQAFGSGRAALLTTDTLWRWKLDEPSDSPVVALFWQQLLLAIGRRAEKPALHFAALPPQVRTEQVIPIQISGTPGKNPPRVVAKTPEGRNIPLLAKRSEADDTAWSVEWTPNLPGDWEISAEAEGAHRATLLATATEEIKGELAPTAPALDLLRTLAGETGGALLTTEIPFAWRKDAESTEKKPDVTPTATSERRSSRWNNWTVLSVILACLALDFILRRLWKLL